VQQQQQQKGALISIIRTGVFTILPGQQLGCGVKLKTSWDLSLDYLSCHLFPVVPFWFHFANSVPFVGQNIVKFAANSVRAELLQLLW
jgi:hypothetical protein